MMPSNPGKSQQEMRREELARTMAKADAKRARKASRTKPAGKPARGKQMGIGSGKDGMYY